MSQLILIPAPLHEEGLQALPPYVWEGILSCQVFIVENERTTRRFFKRLSKDIIIDNYEWLHGYDLQFGIISRDRVIKPSAQILRVETTSSR